MRITATALLCVLTAAAWAQEPPAAPKDTVAPIKKVTVYPDRALVTRETRADLARGSTVVAVRDLPAGIIDDSVRAKVGGTARLRGVEVQTYQTERLLGDKPKELQDQLDKLREQIQEVQDRQDSLKAGRDFILSLKAAVARDASEKMAKDKPSIDDWMKTAAFIEDALLKISEKDRKAAKDRRDLEAKTRVAQAELLKVIGQGALTRKRILITVSADAAGAATIEITYGILGTGWVPSYDFHADIEKNEAVFHYYGQILQSTGEDWSNVELSLSTADPAKSVSMPDLEPLLLGTPEGRHPQTKQQNALYGFALQRRVQDLEHIIQCQNMWVTTNKMVDIGAVAGALLPQMASHLFRIATPESAPSDGSPRKVTIAVTKVKCAFERVCTPAVSPYVYLRTEIANENEFPYMPADMHIFRDNHYIGVSAIEMVAPREKFEVFAGVDEAVKATRKLESKRVESGSMNKIYYTWSIKLENFRGKKTALKVIDRVPVSRDSDIDVYVEPETTKPTSQDKDGVLTWTMDLEAGATKELKLAYRVFHPAGRPVAGLE